MVFAYVLGALFVLWVLLHFKTTRADGVLIKTHPFRRMMFHLMPTRNESVVYFEDFIDITELERFIEETRSHYHVSLTHCAVAAYSIGLSLIPKMNRFSAGRRLWQRKYRKISFSMKRQKLDTSSGLAVVQMRPTDDDTFETFTRRINEKIGVERSGKKTYTDKELSLFLSLPRPVLNAAIPVIKWADYHGLLPEAFIGPDPMFASTFIANLGSLGMRAGYHHLYEWGNCPLFLMLGRTEDRPFVVDGEILVKRILHVRFSFDERIDDGLNAGKGIDVFRQILENPYEFFGNPGMPIADAPKLTLPPQDISQAKKTVVGKTETEKTSVTQAA